MMAIADFHGVFPYLVSPIDSSGAVKSDVLARLCDDLINTLWALNQAFAKYNLAACIKALSNFRVTRWVRHCRRKRR